MKKFRDKGFTLVELLIVIALIAILSVAVLATINPIEQSNKARDAKFKNDAAEVLGALERYYASQNAYPWNNGIGVTVESGIAVAVGSTDPLFGVLGAGGTNGVLITTSELKTSFMGKDSFDVANGVDPVDMMYVYHNGLDSNYVCFVPKATANRFTGGSANPELKCITLGSDSAASLLNAGDSGCDDMDNWATAGRTAPGGGYANLMCVPEGTISQ